MTLFELGEEYLEGARLLRGRVSELKTQLAATSGTKSREAIESRISALALEAADACRTASLLMGYYGQTA